MNVWNWVAPALSELRSNGNERLASIMDSMPSWACGDEHDKVDLVYPEALALAKKESNPWLEVFVRHWYLQSQVLHRHNVKGMVGEAIDLLDLSSQEKNKDCPQSICAVQDLANTYAKKDGPGFVDERIEVSLETLAKIGPSWDCYDCIASEYISALEDDGRYDFALEEIDRCRKEILSSGSDNRSTPFSLNETRILIELGNLEAAEKVIKNAENPYAGESFKRQKALLTAVVLAHQGKFSEAEEFILPFREVIKAHSYFVDWGEYVFMAVKGQVRENNEDLNLSFNILIEKLIENGVQRDTLKMLRWQAELAFDRSDSFTLGHIISSAKTLIADLYKDLGATEWLKQIRLNYDVLLNQIFSSEKISAAIEKIKSNTELNIEDLSLSELSTLVDRTKDVIDINLEFYDRLDQNGFEKRAYQFISELYSGGNQNPEIISRLGNSLIELRMFTEFDETFNEQNTQSFDDEQLLQVHWLVANRYESTDEVKAIAALQDLLRIDSELVNVVTRLAKLLAKQGNHKAAIVQWDRAIELDSESADSFHWSKMLSATIVEDWDSVRKSCDVLDISLSSEDGPIDESFGNIRVQVTDENGEKISLFAKRNGPVTAKIVGIRELDENQYVNSEVVFRATPLNQLNCKDDDGYDCDNEGYYTYLFPVYEFTKKVREFVFDVDGVRPETDTWDKLVELFDDFDCVVSVRSSSEYEVNDSVEGKDYKAIYCYVATSSETDYVQLNEALVRFCEESKALLIWPKLANKVSDIDLIKRQAEIEERFNL